jgi:transposase
LNPIEQKWAHAKAKRKKYKCSIEHLFKTKLNHFI